MAEERRPDKLKSFLIGGLLGSVAGAAAAGRVKMPRPPARRETPAGLAAFERAPCFEELVEREREASPEA